jgi:hypothetical protein
MELGTLKFSWLRVPSFKVPSSKEQGIQSRERIN